MGLFGFGKKKNVSDPGLQEPDENQKLQEAAGMEEEQAKSIQEEPAALDTDDEEIDQYYRLGIASQDAGDDAAAYQYLKKAADSGHMLARFTLGTICERGSSAVYQDIPQAIYWYSLAADQGDAGSMFSLGYLYLQTEGRQEEGMAWMQKAADQGDEAAREYLTSLASETERKQKMKEQHEQNVARAKKLLSGKELFLLYSMATQTPYLLEEGDHYVLIYESEQEAHARRESLFAQGYNCKVMRLLRKDYVPALASLYRIGCNAVRMYTQGESFDVYLYDLVRISKKKNIPQGREPVENPGLIRAMLLMRQESGCKAQGGRPAEGLTERCQADISLLLYQKQAKLIFPYLLQEKDGKSESLPLLYKGQEENAPVRVVLLSGEESFAAMKRSNPQLRRKVLTMAEVAKMSFPQEINGFIVDPNGARLAVQLVRRTQNA